MKQSGRAKSLIRLTKMTVDEHFSSFIQRIAAHWAMRNYVFSPTG